MTADLDGLYALLPAVYREQDASRGYPLRALLRIVAGQAALVEADIRGLWDDLFIETCRPWVIPYLGELVSNDLLYDAGRIPISTTAGRLFTDLLGKDLRPPVAARVRTDVAKTIYYRRRKGTLPMLEELAQDVTGWPAHAVEFLQLLGWTQQLEHRRVGNRWTDVRSIDRMDRVDGAFDETSHSVDVRAIAQHEGWYNIHNVGFFLWRLRSYPLTGVPARQAGQPWQYHVSPLGNPSPLFTRWRPDGDAAGLSTELHVAGPIRRALFYDDLTRYRALPPPRPDATDLYGPFDPAAAGVAAPAATTSLFIVRNGVPVGPAQDPGAPVRQPPPPSPPVTLYAPQITCRRLDPWPATPPSGQVLAVDVENGRIAIGDGWGGATTALDVFYHYGFSADMGGGPYERRRWLRRAEPASQRFFVREDGVAPPGVGPVVTTLVAALNAWVTAGRPDAIITLLDSRSYLLPAAVALRNEGWLAIEAANLQRPVLITTATGLEVEVLPSAVPGDPDRNGALTLSGVAMEGFLRVTGDLGTLRLLHCTLVPGRRLTEQGDPGATAPSVQVEASAAGKTINAHLRIEAAFSITGPLSAPERAMGAWLLDSIVDGISGDAYGGPLGAPGPPLSVERSTLLGGVQAKSLDASETIFTAPVQITRTQEGCVRFSYVPPGSQTPRRYRCQPDRAGDAAVTAALQRDPALAAAAQQELRAEVQARLRPEFTALRYGQPAYAQLHLGGPAEISTGAEDGAEMGAFNQLKQPQRESNLRIRLREYLPFGLDAGIIYVT